MALPDVPRVHAEVYSINDAGIAVGEGFDSCYPPWNNLAYQWQYQQGTWVVSPLPQLAGDPEGTAFGVNNAGVVVGYSGNSSAAQFRAVRWDSGVASLVPDLGGDYSIARAINDVGQVAGYSKTAAGTFRAYFFDGTTAVDLGTLPGYEYSVAWGVNNAGTVIGCAFNNWQWPYNIEALYHCAFVWQDGVQHRLSDLIPPGSGWTSLNVATAINARGQITGFGMRPSGTRAFLLTPIVPGDLNCDGSVNFGDINPFVLILSNPTGWQQTYPDCPFLNGDINGDGNVNFGDINPFVALLSGG
jgi:probable HAF family extracellular repeat protein